VILDLGLRFNSAVLHRMNVQMTFFELLDEINKTRLELQVTSDESVRSSLNEKLVSLNEQLQQKLSLRKNVLND